MYRNIFWDITGACNSSCRYCHSGKRSLLGEQYRSNIFMSPDEFEDALSFLCAKGIISPEETQIDLYNWGEAFLHPHFEIMLKIIAKKGFNFTMSTNASILKNIPVEAIPKLKMILFSMSGFSQKSYDQMHGFKFDTICENIKAITSQIRSVSNSTLIQVAFHLYRFNLSEIILAKEFCHKIGIKFFPFYAYLTGFTMAKKYFNGELSSEVVKDIENQIFVEQLEIIRQSRPDNYICPQYSSLAFDESCNVLQCCATDRATDGHIIGKIKDVNFNQLSSYRRNSVVCSLCSQFKLDYMWHNLPILYL